MGSVTSDLLSPHTKQRYEITKLLGRLFLERRSADGIPFVSVSGLPKARCPGRDSGVHGPAVHGDCQDGQ